MDNWNILKEFIDKLANGKPYDNGHGKRNAFREIQTLMNLIEKNDYNDVIVDNLTLRFKDIYNRSIVFGREDEY